MDETPNIPDDAEEPPAQAPPPDASAYSHEIVPPPAPPPPARTARVAIAAVLIVVLGIGSGVFLLLRSASSERSVAELVPADVAAYAKVALSPSTGQKAALRSMLGRLPASKRATVTSSIDDLLERAFRSGGVSYRADVKPWLGDQVAFAVSAGPDGAAFVGIVSADDEGRARTALSRAVRGPTGFSFLVADGFAYISNSATAITDFRARARRANLEHDAGYIAAHDRVGGDGLFFTYVNGKKFAALAGQAGAFLPVNPLALGAAAGTGAFSVRAEQGGLVLAGHQVLPPGARFGTGDPSLVTTTSAGLIGELSFFDLASMLEQAFGQLRSAFPSDAGSPVGQVEGITRSLGVDLKRDVFPWLHGEFSIVLGGLSSDGFPNVGALIEPTDAAALRRTLRALGTHLGPLVRGFDATVGRRSDGFTVHTGGFDIVVRSGHGRLAVASTDAYARTLLSKASDALEDDTVYKTVLGGPADRTVAQVFLRIDRIRAFVEAALPAEARSGYERDAKPWLDLFRAFGARVTITGNETDLRAVLSLAD